jgi:hypothetical protein
MDNILGFMRRMGWGWLIGVIVAGLAFATMMIVVWMLHPPTGLSLALSTAEVTVVPAPTLTQVIAITQATITATPYVSPEGISVGGYVQITGTGGIGLRLREGPGTSFAQRFLGMEDEVYLVKDGPKDVDGLTWWYLEAPYDKNRTGWAAAKYLEAIKPPAN